MSKKIQGGKIVQTLQDLGLSANEALLYSVCLRYPKSTVQELNVRSPFPRTMLYHILNQLSARGLISTKKDKWKTVYTAEDPERLYDLLSQREKEFEREAHQIRNLIPDLKNRYRMKDKRPSVRLFEGVEEYKKALEDIILSRPKEIWAYETLGKKRPGLEIRELHEHKRIVKKIQKNIIFFENKESAGYLAKRKYDDFTQFRNITEENIKHFDVDLMLYDDKMLYTSYEEREPVAMLIEDKKLAQMQKNIFFMLWKQGEDRTLLSFNRKKV